MQSIYREFCGVDQWRKYVFYALIGFWVEDDVGNMDMIIELLKNDDAERKT